MKKYFGNYLGLVVDDRDPENRGRTKVFIPHVMPALYESWNKEGKDIKFNITDSGLPTGLDTEIVDRLQKILPWAECAAPIFGAGPAGKYDYSTGALRADVQNVSNRRFDTLQKQGAGAETGFNLSNLVDIPTATTNNPTSTYNYINNTPWSAGFISYVVGRNDNNFVRAGLHTDYATAVRKGLSSGWTALNPTVTQVQPGDIVLKNRGSNKLTFNSTWTGISHGDIVTGSSGNSIRTIGGNLSNTVSVTNVPGKNGAINSSNYWAVLRPPSSVANNIAATAEQQFQTWSSKGWKESSPEALGLLNNYYKAGNLSVPGVTQTSAPEVNPSIDLPAKQDANTKPQLTEETGTVQDSGTSISLLVDENGQVSASQLEAEILKQIKSNPNSIYNNGKIPKNGERYGLDGTPESWAKFYTQLAGHESSYFNIPFKEEINGVPEPGGSGGLFQLGRDQIEIWADVKPELAQTYGFQKGVQYADEQYLNPNFNTTGMLFIGEGLLTQNFAVGPGEGLGRTIGSLSWNKIAAGTNPGLGATNPTLAATSGAAKQPTVPHPTPVASIGGPNTNYMPTGMFGSARAGQTVWVFFQEGNPLFPVYFAASYGANEWANITQASSPDPIKNEKDPIQGVQTTLSLDAGGIASKQIISGQESGFEKDEFAFQVFGKNGSALTFTFLATLLNSKYDFKQHTQGDAHYVTGGNRTDRTTGDHTIVCEQDLIITVGNWSQEALDAATEIQGVINEAMKAAKDTYESSGGGSGGGGSTSRINNANTNLDDTIAQGANTGYINPFEGTNAQFETDISLNLTNSQAGKSNIAGLASGAQSMDIFGDTGRLQSSSNPTSQTPVYNSQGSGLAPSPGMNPSLTQ